MTPQEITALQEIKESPDLTYMIRPCSFHGWGIYKPLGINRAKLLITSEAKDDLRKLLKTAEVRYV